MGPMLPLLSAWCTIHMREPNLFPHPSLHCHTSPLVYPTHLHVNDLLSKIQQDAQMPAPEEPALHHTVLLLCITFLERKSI